MQKTADKLRKLADGMTRGIEDRRRPMTQNPTPKRMREYRGRCLEADNDERTQKALYALATAHESGAISPQLAKLTTKAAIAPLVRKPLDHGGYYEVFEGKEYGNKTPEGCELQAMIEAKTDTAADAARKHRQETERLVDRLRFCDIPGFFPTPAPVIEIMLRAADIEAGMLILEPSAGIGTIADAIKERHAVTLHCGEIHCSLREVLKHKGHDLAFSDFMEYEANGTRYDRVIQNPPFESLADIDHIWKAYSVLKPGGRLVSLASPSPLFREQAKAQKFRDWLDEVDCKIIDIPDGSFTGVQSFRQTGVAVKMFVIDKPAA